MGLCLAVDVGGTKLAAGIVTENGKILAKRRVLTPRSDDAEEVFSALAATVVSVRAELALESAPALVACGVGCGGPMTRGGKEVSPLNIPSWRGFALHERVEELTGLPTAVDNDAKALTLGEAWAGAGRGRRDFLSMVISTGVGGGIILDGRLLDGESGNAGHIGHVVVEPEGRLCACGARGCLEAEASGTAIEEMCGSPPSEAGPEIVERTGRLVGRAVASVVNLLDLPLALIGGSVALGFGRPFFEAARAELAERARLEFSRGSTIAPAALGENGPLVGAGAVGWRSRGLEIL